MAMAMTQNLRCRSPKYYDWWWWKQIFYTDFISEVSRQKIHFQSPNDDTNIIQSCCIRCKILCNIHTAEGFLFVCNAFSCENTKKYRWYRVTTLGIQWDKLMIHNHFERECLSVDQLLWNRGKGSVFNSSFFWRWKIGSEIHRFFPRAKHLIKNHKKWISFLSFVSGPWTCSVLA